MTKVKRKFVATVMPWPVDLYQQTDRHLDWPQLDLVHEMAEPIGQTEMHMHNPGVISQMHGPTGQTEMQYDTFQGASAKPCTIKPKS
jgi:hypothetical protein